MPLHWLNTDGPFPDDTLVAVGFSLSGSRERTTWPERAGTVVGRVGEDEWEVAVVDPRAIETRGGEEWSPYVYRNSAELRALTLSEYDEMIAEADHEIASQKARRWRQESDEFDQAVERAKNVGASRDQILEAIDAGLAIDDYANAIDDGATHDDVIKAKVELALDPSDYGYQLRTGMTVREIMELEAQAKTDRETDPIYLTAASGERNTDRGLQAATETENQRLRSLLNEVHRTLSGHFGHEAQYAPWALELLAAIEIEDPAADVAERGQEDDRQAETDRETDPTCATADGGALNTGRSAQAAAQTLNIDPLAGPPTWLDFVPHQNVVERLLDRLDQEFPDQATYLEMAGGDVRYSLWLRLADEHLDALPRSEGKKTVFRWRYAYDHGWSPRDAAFAAWSGVGENPQVWADMNLGPTSSRLGASGKGMLTDEDHVPSAPEAPSI